MAFDFTKINGYKAEMTAEEKLALLDSYEHDYTGYVKKDVLDKTLSKLGEVEKKLKEKMSDDERKEADRIEAENALKLELEGLRKEKTISENKSRYLSLGYDEALANETAIAFVDGKMEQVFENQKLFIENIKKAERAALLAGERKPLAGTGNKTMTKKEFDELGYKERLELLSENPELYKQLNT